MKTILIPIDYSPAARQAATFGLALAPLCQGRIILLHAYAPAAVPSPYAIPLQTTQWDETVSRQWEERLEAFRNELLSEQSAHSTVSVTTQVSLGATPEVIENVARQEHADLIVLGTSGASTTWDHLMGSLSALVARHAPCPVWIISGPVQPEKIRSLTYFADLEGDEVNCIRQVLELARRLNASTKVIHVSRQAPGTDWDSVPVLDRLKAVFAGESDLHFWQFSAEDSHQHIEEYIQKFHPGTIVLAHHYRPFLQALFHSSLIRKLALSGHDSLLVLPKAVDLEPCWEGL